VSPERRSAASEPPEGGRVYQDGRESPKRPQPQASKAYKTPTSRATDSIAPTEFPKVRSATGGIRLLHRALHRHIRPSGGEDSSQVNAQARVLDGAIPEDLVKRLAKPAIHRPQMVPAHQQINRTSVPRASATQQPKANSLRKQQRSRRAPSRRVNQSKHSQPLQGKQGLLVRYQGQGPDAPGGCSPIN
jgi:hypothetical protein